MTEQEQSDAHNQLDMFEEYVGGYDLMKSGSIYISLQNITDCGVTDKPWDYLFSKELQAISNAPELYDPAYTWRNYRQSGTDVQILEWRLKDAKK